MVLALVPNTTRGISKAISHEITDAMIGFAVVWPSSFHCSRKKKATMIEFKIPENLTIKVFPLKRKTEMEIVDIN